MTVASSGGWYRSDEKWLGKSGPSVGPPARTQTWHQGRYAQKRMSVVLYTIPWRDRRSYSSTMRLIHNFIQPDRVTRKFISQTIKLLLSMELIRFSNTCLGRKKIQVGACALRKYSIFRTRAFFAHSRFKLFVRHHASVIRVELLLWNLMLSTFHTRCIRLTIYWLILTSKGFDFSLAT